jgi:hypothetical protein
VVLGLCFQQLDTLLGRFTCADAEDGIPDDMLHRLQLRQKFRYAFIAEKILKSDQTMQYKKSNGRGHTLCHSWIGCPGSFMEGGRKSPIGVNPSACCIECNIVFCCRSLSLYLNNRQAGE